MNASRAFSKHAGKVCFLAGVVAAFSFGWAGFPRVLYRSAPQPVQFSHKVHTSTAGMQCEDCHTILSDGRFSAIPVVEKCAGCHAAPLGETPEEKRFVERYVATNQEIPWRVYARQPDNVAFSHASHVKLAKLECARCHGEHAKTDKLRDYQFNPVTGYSRDIGEPKFLRAAARRGPTPAMKMDDCIACHQEKKVDTFCLDCHK